MRSTKVSDGLSPSGGASPFFSTIFLSIALSSHRLGQQRRLASESRVYIALAPDRARSQVSFPKIISARSDDAVRNVLSASAPCEQLTSPQAPQIILSAGLMLTSGFTASIKVPLELKYGGCVGEPTYALSIDVA